MERRNLPPNVAICRNHIEHSDYHKLQIHSRITHYENVKGEIINTT